MPFKIFALSFAVIFFVSCNSGSGSGGIGGGVRQLSNGELNNSMNYYDTKNLKITFNEKFFRNQTLIAEDRVNVKLFETHITNGTTSSILQCDISIDVADPNINVPFQFHNGDSFKVSEKIRSGIINTSETKKRAWLEMSTVASVGLSAKSVPSTYIHCDKIVENPTEEVEVMTFKEFIDNIGVSVSIQK